MPVAMGCTVSLDPSLSGSARLALQLSTTTSPSLVKGEARSPPVDEPLEIVCEYDESFSVESPDDEGVIFGPAEVLNTCESCDSD